MRDKVFRRGKPLWGLCKLTILLFLLLPSTILTAPQRFKRMDATLEKNNADKEKVNNSTISGEVMGNEVKGSSGTGVNTNSNTDWTKAITLLFLKWGYKEEEIPEPFGSKKTSDMPAPSPEFATILKGIKDSLPSDLRVPIENIVHSDGVKAFDGSSTGNMTKLDEIDETIKEIIASLTAKEEAGKQISDSSKSLQPSTLKGDADAKKNEALPNGMKHTSNDHKTFCAEVDGPCDDDDDETDTSTVGNVHKSDEEKHDGSVENSSKLSQDKVTLDKLIADLTSIMTKPKEMTVEDSSKAKDDLIQISTLVHEIESIAESNEKACNVNSNGNESKTPPKLTIPENKPTLEIVVTTSKTAEIIAVTTAMTQDDKVLGEKAIAENMNKHPSSSLDVAIVGNDIKEVGHQLAKIAEAERQRAANPTHEALLEEKNDMKELFKEIDEKGHKVVEKDRNNVDLHKQVEETGKLVSGHHTDKHSSMKQKGVDGEKVLDKPNHSINKSESVEETKEVGTSASTSKETSVPLSETGKETDELKGVLKDEIDEVSQINKAHEKHKADMLSTIRKLKLSSNTEEEKQRVQNIEDIIKDIDQEHYNALELQEKLSKMADSKDVQHAHTEHHGYKSGKPHDNLGQKIETLQNIGDSLAAKISPSSEYDTTIEETLHSKKVMSKDSKHHNEKEPSHENTDESINIIGDEGSNSEQQKNSEKANQYTTLNLDELALEPAEVNYNGGIHAKIDVMRNQYPNGHWPDTDVWPNEDEIETHNGKIDLSANHEGATSIEQTGTSQTRSESSDESALESNSINNNSGHPDTPVIPETNEQGESDLNSIASNGPSEENVGKGSKSGDNVDVIDLEHELDLIENSDRVETLLNVLDNGPLEAKFPDFSQASHHESDDVLSAEHLESIISKQHGLVHKDATSHHVQEHELADNPQSNTQKRKRSIKRLKRKVRRVKSTSRLI